MTEAHGNNVRFHFDDEEESEAQHGQDPIELNKLQQLSLAGGGTLGANAAGQRGSEAGGGSEPMSRSTSMGPPGSAGISRRSSKADVHSHPHSRIHTPDTSPPSTPRGDPGTSLSFAATRQISCISANLCHRGSVSSECPTSTIHVPCRHRTTIHLSEAPPGSLSPQQLTCAPQRFLPFSPQQGARNARKD